MPSLAAVLQGLASSRPEDSDATSSGTPQQLSERVSTMLHNIEKELDAAEAKIGQKMKVLDVDDDGHITKEELDQVRQRRAETYFTTVHIRHQNARCSKIIKGFNPFGIIALLFSQYRSAPSIISQLRRVARLCVAVCSKLFAYCIR